MLKSRKYEIWQELVTTFCLQNFESFLPTYIHTLCPISVSGLSTVRYKTILNAGSVGWAVAAPPTYKLGKFLSWPLALSMLTYSNFQINGASRETLKPPDPYFASKIEGLEVSEFLPKLYFFWILL